MSSTRDFIEKDYYAALGVAKDADAAAIKKAYRQLARDLHPDKNPGDAAAEARFKEVSEAYDVLSDDTKRREYDEARTLFGAGLRGSAPGGMPFDLGDLLGGARGGGTPGGFGGFGDVLGGLFGQRGGAGRPRRGADVEAEVTLSFPDALRGATVPVRMTTEGVCETCRGSGAAPGTSPRTCTTCQGAGVTTRNQGGFAFSEPCRSCRGKGRTVDTPCSTCAGTGAATTSRTINVRIPPGVSDGQKVRLAGRGGPGQSGGQDGDLLVAVRVTPHPVLSRRGDDLLVTVPVTFAEAVDGTTVRVPAPGGPVTLKVPPGTSSGTTLRARGRGVPRKSGAGDLLVVVQVDVPKDLPPDARKALAAFAKATDGHNPRKHLEEVQL